MKKTILSIAFATAGIFAFTAMAQEPCCNAGQPQHCCQAAGDSCCQAAQHKHARPAKPDLFKGITLTEEQQAAVNALNEKYAQERKDAKKEKAEAKAKERKDGNESRKSYMEEMKQILTPEQYVVYLENVATNRPQGQIKKAPKIKHGKDIKREGRKEMKARKGGEAKPAVE